MGTELNGTSASMWDEARFGDSARREPHGEPQGAKTVSESQVVLAHITSAHDTNLYGGVHGGFVMKLIDDAAAAAAARHAQGPAVTASVDSMRFLNPALVGDLLNVSARLARVGRTSMDVRVDVTAERWNEPGQTRDIVHAYLTFVAVDGNGRPRAVAPLTLNSDEQTLADEALARRERRQEN